jgi:hypothetical protein
MVSSLAIFDSSAPDALRLQPYTQLHLITEDPCASAAHYPPCTAPEETTVTGLAAIRICNCRLARSCVGGFHDYLRDHRHERWTGCGDRSHDPGRSAQRRRPCFGDTIRGLVQRDRPAFVFGGNDCGGRHRDAYPCAARSINRGISSQCGVGHRGRRRPNLGNNSASATTTTTPHLSGDANGDGGCARHHLPHRPDLWLALWIRAAQRDSKVGCAGSSGFWESVRRRGEGPRPVRRAEN